MSIHHTALLDASQADTVLEYAHALLADHEVRRGWFAVSTVDAIAAVQRAVIACEPPGRPATEKPSRPRTDVPLRVARALQDLAEREGVSMAVLAHEAVRMLYASRNLPLPMKEKS